MSRCRALPLLTLLVFFLSASADPPWRVAAAESTFKVGVILDMATLIGKVSRMCITMAVEDFYAAHRDYATKISLRFRDAGGDAIGAASAALELLKNEEVQAILGPQRSIQAKFVMELGTRVQVPVVAFSAKSSSLSPILSPYFVRAAMDDSSQAKAIAAIVQKYQWREVIPIFEDSDYGSGMAPFLVDELQDKGAAVPFRLMIPMNSSADTISSELDKLKKRWTRVFVVHVSYELGSLLFRLAKEAGMMEKGYVWITTYSLTVVSDIQGAAAGEAMEGVVGLKPYFRRTARMEDFKQRWAERFKQENPGASLTEPVAFGLWAYDAVWALAMAAEKVGPSNLTFSNAGDGDFGGLGRSPVGPKLLRSISSVDFEGLTGRFRLVEGQLDASTSEIVNVVGGKLTRVSFWTAAHGVTRHLTKGPGLRSIVWPGGESIRPKGWEWPTNGRRLRILVPMKPGFEQFVNVKKDKSTGKYTFDGFCIQVFKKVIASLPYDVPFDFVAFDDGYGQNNGTYDDLVYRVFLGEYDGAVGDVTILANRSRYVDFTQPYTDSGVSMVVPVRDGQRKSAWVFKDPLSGDLWLASGGFVVFTGIVVWILERRENSDFSGGAAEQAGTVFYFVFSTLVFAHRDRVESNWTRFVVVVWVFVVLILTSSYTASLTSMLTAQQLQPTVTDLGDLIRRNERVGYLNDSFMPALLKELRVTNIFAYNSPDEYAAALDKGTDTVADNSTHNSTYNGAYNSRENRPGAGAIVDEIPYLKVFLSMFCGKYAMVGPTYKTNGFGFVFPKGSPLLPDVSRQVLNFTEGKDFETLETILYGERDCPAESFKLASSSLEFSNFGGLFIITGTASGGALLIFLIKFFFTTREKVDSILKSQESPLRKLVLLLKLFDEKDPAAVKAEAKEGEEMDVIDGGAVAGEGPSIHRSQPESPQSICTHPFEGEDYSEHPSLTTPPPEGNETLCVVVPEEEPFLFRQPSTPPRD